MEARKGGTLRPRPRALPEDVVGFVKDTQPEQWEKFCTLYPSAPEQKFLERVAEQLNKADPLAANQTMRTFGTLGVLRHELRDRGTRFFLCQFKPEHDLNPDSLARYAKNRLRVVPKLVYSPWATEAELTATGLKAKAWRIELVLFVNGIPVATLELKSEFKQAADRAIKQYKTTRLPVDPVTKKPEPLLTFKRGALVHFAVSQYEVATTTRLPASPLSFSLSIAAPRTAARATRCRQTCTATRPTTSGTRCCCPTTCSISSHATCISKLRRRRIGTVGNISRRR